MVKVVSDLAILQNEGREGTDWEGEIYQIYCPVEQKKKSYRRYICSHSLLAFTGRDELIFVMVHTNTRL